MNTLRFAAPFSLALFALFAQAQQGPAGIPGVVELLVESVTPVIANEPLPPPPSQRPDPAAQSTVPEVAKAPNAVGPAKAVARARKPRKAAIEDCSKTSDPARCRLYQKARKTCQPLIGDTHRQCLRDVLTSNQ